MGGREVGVIERGHPMKWPRHLRITTIRGLETVPGLRFAISIGRSFDIFRVNCVCMW
jgi:hypothetical protein